MESGDQFVLRLRQIERQAVGLGNAGDEEDDEADELRHDEPQATLRLDDVAAG